MPAWAGKYDQMVEALILHGNQSARFLNDKHEYAPDIFLTFQEGQVLEYIIDHDNDDESMSCISRRLGIPQSSFSKHTKTLCKYELIAKYQLVTNRKNIILRPTQKGREVYRSHIDNCSRKSFAPFFAALDSLTQEQIDTVSGALIAMAAAMHAPPEPEKPQMIKL